MKQFGLVWHSFTYKYFIKNCLRYERNHESRILSKTTECNVNYRILQRDIDVEMVV